MRKKLAILTVTLALGFSGAWAETDTIKIDGMSCKVGCVAKVEKALKKVKGLEKAKAKLGSVRVTYDENVAKPEDIKSAIVKAGYKVKNP